jgi:integrase
MLIEGCDVSAGLLPALKFHALRHTYASVCVAAGIPAFDISRFMGHAKPTTTLSIYAHLFEDNNADAMAALGAMENGISKSNVIPLRGLNPAVRSSSAR